MSKISVSQNHSEIIHFTTLHARTDTRVRVKEVSTLASSLDQSVALYVQDGGGNEFNKDPDFLIYDTGPPAKNRWKRMTVGAWRMYRAVSHAGPKVAHFHDPELIPWAILLRLQGIKVIYDVHENLEKQTAHKSYLPKWSRRLLSWLLPKIEGFGVFFFSAVVVVGPDILGRMPPDKTLLLPNYPLLSEFKTPVPTTCRGKHTFIYVGNLSAARGIVESVKAITIVGSQNACLTLYGKFREDAFENEAKSMAGWEQVNYEGWGDRDTVGEALSNACAGLATLHPTPQYLIAYPVKVFEYMAAGLPVIASDFPPMRETIGEAKCGILVNPLAPEEIAKAMRWMLENPEEASKMGQRGRKAIEDKYSWEQVGQQLIELYRSLL